MPRRPCLEGRRPPRPDSMGDNANVIAVDDYFRRLDEALATAGLSTAPEPAGDLAAIAGSPGLAADRSGDAETMIVPRPAPVAADARPAEGEESGEASKLVDAFSALLAAEEGDGSPVVAGPVEMVGAPAPVPPPAVEWTPGQTAAAPVEAAAETVALQAVTADAVEAAAIEERAAPATVEAADRAPSSRRAAPADRAESGGGRPRRLRCGPTRRVTPPSRASTSTCSPTRWRRRSCTA